MIFIDEETQFNFIEFIDKYQSVIFALLGLVIASFLNIFSNWVLKNRERKLDISQKLINEHLNAYKEIRDVVADLTKHSSIDKFQGKSKEFILTCPEIFISYEKFINWYLRYGEACKRNQFWVNEDLYKELRFLSMIITNIEIFIRKNPKQIIPVGVIVKSDIGKVQDNISNLVRDYFLKEIYDLKPKKYSWLVSENEFIARYENTDFYNFISQFPKLGK